MSIIETITELPAECNGEIFGQFDTHMKKIERTLHVSIINRDSGLKVIGGEVNVRRAIEVIRTLTELAKRGNTVTEQNVDYALSLVAEDNANALLEIDQDIITRTVQGKPVKPRTMGQKHYVDMIRQKMIVFGIGPAGTGKTYLAMREKTWDFCPAICRAR